MKKILLLCFLLLGCQPENSQKPNAVEKQPFGKPFYGKWNGAARGTVIAPDIACENIQLIIKPGSLPELLAIQKFEGRCNGNEIRLNDLILKINDKKVYKDFVVIGQASSFFDWSSGDGRWFTFKADASEIMNTTLYVGLAFFSKDSGGPSLLLGVSLNPDGSDNILTGILRLSKERDQ